MWDLGGGDKIRLLWRHYIEGCSALVFVADSSDTERLATLKEDISRVLDLEESKGMPIMLVANKQDLPNARRGSEIAK